jgi:hypothetical protein
MQAVYPATYKDRFGEEFVSIGNDGKMLSMVVREVEFRGTDWDGLEPTEPLAAASFTLQQGSLCSCTIEADMPVPVVMAGETVDGILKVELELGEPLPHSCLDRESLKLRLQFGNHVPASTGRSGWFEDELLDLRRQMPANAHLKACINFAFSDYSPYGHGMFGCLACFRGKKAGYRAVAGKKDLFGIWHTMTEFVQETYLCPEFERRLPGTGYRG